MSLTRAQLLDKLPDPQTSDDPNRIPFTCNLCGSKEAVVLIQNGQIGTACGNCQQNASLARELGLTGETLAEEEPSNESQKAEPPPPPPSREALARAAAAFAQISSSSSLEDWMIKGLMESINRAAARKAQSTPHEPEPAEPQCTDEAGRRTDDAPNGATTRLRPSHSANRSEVDGALVALCQPGQVYELRALGTKKGTLSGYYNDNIKMAQDAVRCCDWRLEATGVYCTINPVKPELLARAKNRVREYVNKDTTADTDIAARHWLPLDFDPVRPSGISATDSEHDSAFVKLHQVCGFLRERGWPDPLLIDSGNGTYALYPIEQLPNDDPARDFD